MPNLKELGDDWFELYAALPETIQWGIQEGKFQASYTALRKWGRLAVRHRKAICQLMMQGECSTLTDAIQRYSFSSQQARMQHRMRQTKKRGEAPEHVWNATPPAWSGDLEGFFIPPDYPEREMVDDVEITPIPRKNKRWMINKSEMQ